MTSPNATVNQEVSKQDVISVRVIEKENYAKNHKYLDDDKLKYIIQIMDDKIMEMTTYLKD